MIWLKRVLILLFLVVAFLLSLAFLTQNENPVVLSFFVYELNTTAGGSFVIGLFLGLVATLIATWPIITTYKFRLSRVQKRELDAVNKV